MATRSYIVYQDKENKTYRGIYCHHDGYYEHNGKILISHYNSYEKAKTLIELGDMGDLGETLETCNAYHRDHQEDLHISEIDTVKLNYELPKEYSFVYLYRNNKWQVNENGVWMDLKEVLNREKIEYSIDEETKPEIPSGYIKLDPTLMYAIPIKDGFLDIRVSQDPDYPGLDVEYIKFKEDKENLTTRPRVLIECPEESQELRTLIWGNKTSEDYSDEIIFEE